MKVYLNDISGIPCAIISMFMSKRTWSRDLEMEIRNTCKRVLDYDGYIRKEVNKSDMEKFQDWINKLTRWGVRHITMLRFIDFSITVEGLHRGGQDDWDAHAARFNNRIIRSSTRLSTFDNEMSDYYKGKIIPTDVALAFLGIDTPNKIEYEGSTYIKTVNGYIKEEYADNKDVKRGLYMLSIPSNFIFKINLTEWGHVYKERNKLGSANPEVKECCESIADMIENAHSVFNRQLFEAIKN